MITINAVSRATLAAMLTTNAAIWMRAAELSEKMLVCGNFDRAATAWAANRAMRELARRAKMPPIPETAVHTRIASLLCRCEGVFGEQSVDKDVGKLMNDFGAIVG